MGPKVGPDSKAGSKCRTLVVILWGHINAELCRRLLTFLLGLHLLCVSVSRVLSSSSSLAPDHAPQFPPFATSSFSLLLLLLLRILHSLPTPIPTVYNLLLLLLLLPCTASFHKIGSLTFSITRLVISV